jgi:hypothetical protein
MNTEGTTSLPMLERQKFSIEHIRERSRDSSMLNFRVIKAKSKRVEEADQRAVS